MTKEKQIEEMAKVIARRSTAFRNPNVAFMTTATKTAESLYNAGYRKASEIVGKIIGEILFYMDTHKEFGGADFGKFLFEIEMKYTEEGK